MPFIAIGLAVGLLVGAAAADWDISENYREAAVKAGCGAYDRQTGDWMWVGRMNDGDE